MTDVLDSVYAPSRFCGTSISLQISGLDSVNGNYAYGEFVQVEVEFQSKDEFKLGEQIPLTVPAELERERTTSS